MTFGEFRGDMSKLAPGVDPDLLDLSINNRYQKILDRHPWKGLETEGRVVTVAAYQTGTVSLINGSAAVTGTGTIFTALMTGRKFRAIARAENYTFTHTGAATGTLDRVYEGDTAAAAGFLIYEDTYDLASNFKLPLVTRNERSPREIVHWTRAQLDRAAPARGISGEPQIYVFASDTALGLRRAQLYPVPAYAASYPYSYIKSIPRFTDADTQLPLASWIPIECLTDFVKADMKADRDAEAKAEAELLRAIVRDINIGGPQALRMHPRYTRHRLDRATRRLP